MSAAVKISDIEMNFLRASAELQSRSISGQAEHWLRLGRAFESDPRFGYAKIEKALKGLLDPSELDGEEQEQYFDKLGEILRQPSTVEDDFFAEINGAGDGVGMDDAGNLVYGPNHPKYKK